MARVFDASLNQKLDYIWHSFLLFSGLAKITFYNFFERIDKALDVLEQNEMACAGLSVFMIRLLVFMTRLLVAAAAALLQMLILVIILCPLAFLYVLGLFISAGLSLARLIQRDYGDQANEGHLRSALLVLYSLAVLQGVVFCYRCILRFIGRRRLVNEVAKQYRLLDKDLKQSPVWEYMVETKAGCGKDPSFIKERNLITYAMELMQSINCPDKYISGLRVLGTTLDDKRSDADDKGKWPEGQKTLINHLIGSPSSSHLLLKLLHTLDLRSPNGTVSRLHAARIVANISDEIRLSQFPGTIQCIASLLDACQYQDGDNDSTASTEFSREVMEQGLLILKKLTTDEDNCKIISSTHGLLSKIMMPTASDLLHCVDHCAWTDMVNISLSVISQLAAAPGVTGKKLRRKISKNKEAITSMETILRCSVCATTNLKSVILAIKILKQLGNDSSWSMDIERKRNFLKKLTGIFTNVDMDTSNRRSAAEALLISLPSERNAMTLLESDNGVLRVLTQMLLDQKDNNSYRLIAVQILEHLCVHYPKDGDHVNNLKEAMIDAMPKVLKEILRCESTGKAVQTETKANEVNSLAAPARDIENQTTIPQDNAQNTSSSNHRQDDEDMTLLAALLSLCVVICDTFICADQYLAQKLGEIASGGSSFSFPRKLKEMVERHSQPADNTASQRTMKHTSKEMVERQNQPTDNTISLRIMKHTCKMATLMIKHKCSYNIDDMESLMQSLSDASKKMLGAEGLMFMASTNNGTEKPTGATLASLVKEAQEILDQKKVKASAR
ncbi:hypothetical protein BS78_05G046200 [Paspalum vaginatum]|nr:hypothetical protein BS78_05G046200 [Paspalum vaginatum]